MSLAGVDRRQARVDSRPRRVPELAARAIALQQSVGNCGTARILQRYETAAAHAVLSGAAEFEAQTVDAANQQIHAPAAPAGAPTVRVSDDGQMALEDSNLTGRQPKVFYTTQAIVHASNTDLQRVGSDYELYVDRANALRVTMASGANHTLSRVLPRTRAFSGGARAPSQEGLTMHVAPDCIMVAAAVMKHGGNDRQPRLPAGLPDRPYAEIRVAQYMAKWVNETNAPTSYWNAVNFYNWLDLASSAAMNAFKEDLQMSQGTLDTIATAYAQVQNHNPALADQVAQTLGVNIHAAPNVGEAYETHRIGVGQPAQTTPGAGGRMTRQFWAQHIGAVVAVSGQDRVTLENYARSHELGAMRTGADYYFQMYGPHHGQTWHEAWTGATVPVGQNVQEALTVVVRP